MNDNSLILGRLFFILTGIYVIFWVQWDEKYNGDIIRILADKKQIPLCIVIWGILFLITYIVGNWRQYKLRSNWQLAIDFEYDFIIDGVEDDIWANVDRYAGYNIRFDDKHLRVYMDSNKETKR